MCIFLLYDIKTSHLIMQTCSQKNARVKINRGLVSVALKKKQNRENKKGKNQIRSKQNWKNPNTETSCTISVFFA